MKQPSIQIDRENKTVTIVMRLEKPRPSKSTGRTRLIATTGGLKTSAESYARQPVFFTANVFFFPTNTDESREHSEASEPERRSPTKHGNRHRTVVLTNQAKEEKNDAGRSS